MITRLTAGVAALLALSGCAASTATQKPAAGPLVADSGNATLCLYAKDGSAVTDAQDIVEHPGAGVQVTLRSISLVNAHGVTETGGALLPVSAGVPTIGSPYVPTSAAFGIVDWSQRLVVDEPRTTTGPLAVVFGVSLVGHRGSASGTRVTYSVNGNTYSLVTTTRLVIAPKPC